MVYNFRLQAQSLAKSFDSGSRDVYKRNKIPLTVPKWLEGPSKFNVSMFSGSWLTRTSIIFDSAV